MEAEVIDAQFHRAVDIVQSMPKSGPVQTSYEDKLGLYALYKQATEGNISISRPGLLDMLGRAKWDAWHKRKGLDRIEAQRQYVSNLLKILRRHSDREGTRARIAEIEAFDSGIARPASSASSHSSYHSSQASPPDSPPGRDSSTSRPSAYPIPDPNLPAPDVSPDFIPPSALNHSHRSLLNLAHTSPPDQPFPSGTPVLSALAGPSRDQSLLGGRGGSLHSFRPARASRPASQGEAAPLGFLDAQPRASASRAYTPQIPHVRDFATPDMTSASPFPPIHHPMPVYPPHPGSTSTFANLPPQPLNVPLALQQIQTSLTALHERLTTLERTQGMLLRREERRRNWFWGSSEADELDELETAAERARWPATAVTTALRRRRKGLTLRVIWGLITAIRRAALDVSVGMMVALVGVIVLGGGWRTARRTLSRLFGRWRRALTEP